MLTTIPRDVPDMDLLSYSTLMLVVDMAATMNKKEILDAFSIDEAEFTLDERTYFDEFYAYGKGMAIHTVGQNLIAATRGRNGAQAAMQYLKRFAKEFESDVEGDSTGSFSFTFGSIDKTP